jgi:hypothetical protein
MPSAWLSIPNIESHSPLSLSVPSLLSVSFFLKTPPPPSLRSVGLCLPTPPLDPTFGLTPVHRTSASVLRIPLWTFGLTPVLRTSASVLQTPASVLQTPFWSFRPLSQIFSPTFKPLRLRLVLQTSTSHSDSSPSLRHIRPPLK